jgi:Ran-binding protein 9/10
MRKFFEDPEGGRDYTPLLQQITAGDTIGCGYDFSASSIFFTYNGIRLPNAFGGVYVPRRQYDVYAAIGVEGACKFEVNFGGDIFQWKEGNEWAWRVEGHVGRLPGLSAPHVDDQLPSYTEARRTRLP